VVFLTTGPAGLRDDAEIGWEITIDIDSRQSTGTPHATSITILPHVDIARLGEQLVPIWVDEGIEEEDALLLQKLPNVSFFPLGGDVDGEALHELQGVWLPGVHVAVQQDCLPPL
jgi:hypothetical protein